MSDVPSKPRRTLILAALGGVILVGVVIWSWFAIAARRPPLPTLDGIAPLLDAGRFDEVEARVGAYLRAFPDSIQANMLMAQVSLSRRDQKPQQALDCLKRVRSTDPAVVSIVRLNEGKAYSALTRYDRAEACWLEALRVDPLVPEAGWALLGIYYVQDRIEDSHRLGLALHAIELDPRDRVQLLLELIRQDTQTLDINSMTPILEPVVRQHPDDLYTGIALARALLNNSRTEQGLPILRRLVARFPDNPIAWNALLRGLELVYLPDELGKTLDQLPKSMAGDLRFERYRGIVAQTRREWSTAADAFLHASKAEPADSYVVYRLSRVLKSLGRAEESERFDRQYRVMEEAKLESPALYKEANADKTLGSTPHADLYRRIADNRERLGRRGEALVWYRLALGDQPEDSVSLAAIERLGDAPLPTLKEILASAAGPRYVP